MANVNKKSAEFFSEVIERDERKRRRAGPEEQVEAPKVRASDSGMDEQNGKRTIEDNRHREEVMSRRVTLEDAEDNKRERDDVDAEEQPRKKTMVGELEVNQDVDENEDWYCDGELEGVMDDKTGIKLDPKLVETAEAEEMGYMEEIGVGEEVDESECLEVTGKQPVSTKWVRLNKGSEAEPLVRARLVARDFKVKGDDREGLFAAMPPLEAKKMLFRMAAKDKLVWRKARRMRRKLFFVDVKKAHLNGKVPDKTSAYVRLPDGRVWRLMRWLYGMRNAAQAWEADFAERLESIGFVRGKSAPTTFYREATGCRCVVHGDDFTFLTYDDTGRQIVKDMEGWYDLKLRA